MICSAHANAHGNVSLAHVVNRVKSGRGEPGHHDHANKKVGRYARQPIPSQVRANRRTHLAISTAWRASSGEGSSPG